jgi:flagellar basal body P-ring protein FlgI
MSLSRPITEGGVVDRVLINILKKEVQIQLRKKNYDFKNRNRINIDNSAANKLKEPDANTIDQQSKKIKVEDSPPIDAVSASQTTDIVNESQTTASGMILWVYVCNTTDSCFCMCI